MIVERSYLVRVVQRYEGDDLPAPEHPGEYQTGWLDSQQDEYVCNNWRLISDENELLDDDQWEAQVMQS